MGLLISTETMSNTSHTLLFDCRSHLGNVTQGKKNFEAGHMPEAQHPSLDQHLAAAPNDGGKHPRPERDVLIDYLQHWGINPETRIICYDQNNGAFAARLWWLCRCLGHDDAFVFDGGLNDGIQQGLPVSTLQETFPRGHFTPKATLTNICQVADVLGLSNTLLDARDSARYRGEVKTIDAVAGHIPSAISALFFDNMSGEYFKHKAVLKQRFETRDLTPDSPLVRYCGSGVTAIHNVLALLIAGYPESALYPGSWSEWIADPDRPIEIA